MDKLIFKGKVGIITDASSSTAEVIGKYLEDKGMMVVRNYPGSLYEEKEAALKNAFYYDTCSEAAVKLLKADVLERYQSIDYLLHTDYEVYKSSIETIRETDFKRTVDRNAKSAFVATKIIGGYLAEKGRGAILYLSTLHGEKPTGCSFTYSVGKAAVKMLCREMALFYGRKGVRVNLIEMDMLKGQEDVFDSRLSPFNYQVNTKIPLHRLAEEKDLEGIAAFLLSEEASFINGAEIRVDGGHLLYYRDR